MSGEKLYQEITKIPADIVEDAAVYPKGRRWKKLIATVAACFAVIFIAGGYQAVNTAVATVYITINPYVGIELNRFGGVVGVTALNEDAKTVLAACNQSNNRISVAEEVVLEAQKLGYLKEDGRVTVSVDAENEKKALQYENEIGTAIESELDPESKVTVQVRKVLSAAEIKAAVAQYYGVRESTIQFDSITCEAEHDRAFYEVEFTYGGLEYECEVDAETGAVLEDNAEDDAEETVNVIGTSESTSVGEDTEEDDADDIDDDVDDDAYDVDDDADDADDADDVDDDVDDVDDDADDVDDTDDDADDVDDDADDVDDTDDNADDD